MARPTTCERTRLAVQFMPAMIIPQLLLASLFEGLMKVATDDIDARLWLDVGVVAGCVVLALVLGATTLRRRTP